MWMKNQICISGLRMGNHLMESQIIRNSTVWIAHHSSNNWNHSPGSDITLIEKPWIRFTSKAFSCSSSRFLLTNLLLPISPTHSPVYPFQQTTLYLPTPSPYPKYQSDHTVLLIDSQEPNEMINRFHNKCSMYIDSISSNGFRGAPEGSLPGT